MPERGGAIGRDDMTELSLIASSGSAAGLVLAMDGLGQLLGGHDFLNRWIRGWTVLWWTVSIAATIGGPMTGVVAGSVLAAAGFVHHARVAIPQPRRLGLPIAGLAIGAPLWLAPPFFFDTLVYHLGLPWTWLVNDSFAPIPHHVFSHFPFAASAVYLLPVAWGVPEAAAALHWMSFIVALVGLHRLAARLGAGQWSWFAPAALCGCWHVVWIAGVAAADMVALAAFVAALDAVTDEPAVRWLDLSLACGLAAATKYPAVVTTAALLAVAGALLWRHWRQWLGAAAGAVALASFVPVRNLITTGNPVFPLMWSVFGGTGWTARDDARYGALVHEGVGGIGSLATGLWRLFDPPTGLGWAALVTVPLAAAAVVRGRDRGAAQRLAAITCAATVGWLVTSQTVRYAFPLAAALAVLAAAGLAVLSRPARLIASLGLVIAISVGLLQLGGMVFGTLQMDRLWFGDRDAWRAAVTLDDPLPAYRAAADLPTGSRLLVVGEGRSWACPIPHHVSSPYDLQLVQAMAEAAPTADRLAADVAAAGWTHLMVNRGELERLGGPDFQVLRWRSAADAQRWRQFLRRSATVIWRHDDCFLLRLHDVAAAAPDPGRGVQREPDPPGRPRPDSEVTAPVDDTGARRRLRQGTGGA